MGSKHCNTDGRCVWTVRGTTLKNKPHFVTLYDSILFNLWTFPLTPLYQSPKYLSIYQSIGVNYTLIQSKTQKFKYRFFGMLWKHSRPPKITEIRNGPPCRFFSVFFIWNLSVRRFWPNQISHEPCVIGSILPASFQDFGS